MGTTRKGTKVALLLVTGAVLLASFATFAVLFFRYERGGDANNEDVLVAQATRAMQEGDPVRAVGLYERLRALNPFEKKYETDYLHALVALRDFDGIIAATNGTSLVFTMTEDEQAVETAVKRGAEFVAAKAYDQAMETFAAVTNLNAFAVTPFLVQAQAKAGRPDLALTTALAYTARFAHPALIQQAAEWSTLAERRDLVAECRTRALRVHGRIGVSLAHYCDALIAWMDGKADELVQSMRDLNGEIDSTLARLMSLQCAALEGTAEAVEKAYDAVVEEQPAKAPIRSMARAAVKGFLAKRFPSKIRLEEIQRLTALIHDPENPDVDIVRLSLLAKSASGTLLASELEEALKRFPNDRGLAVIRQQQAKH